ncbi:MAG: DUF134 domain-containing protein [Bacteroidales bacterium]|nr:DUF134 domain-containing protein [Bacteroidales bacterium]
MARPKRRRKMSNPPNVRGFRPFGASNVGGNPVELLYEEFEALRLADYEKLSQVEAAEIMEVSRPTFTRIYDRALKKIAQALNETRSFIIEGGNIYFDDQWYRCNYCHSVYKSSKGRQKHCAVCSSADIEHINSTVEDSLEAKKQCICDECGRIINAENGTPCREIKCPDCGGILRKEYV